MVRRGCPCSRLGIVYNRGMGIAVPGMTHVYVEIGHADPKYFDTIKDARAWLKSKHTLGALYRQYEKDMDYIAKTGKRNSLYATDILIAIYDSKDYDNPDPCRDLFPIETYNLYDMLVRNGIIKKHRTDTDTIRLRGFSLGLDRSLKPGRRVRFPQPPPNGWSYFLNDDPHIVAITWFT